MCFAVSAHGDLITSYRAVKDAAGVGVQFPGERELDAVVLATDPGNDLAVLSVRRTANAFLLAPDEPPSRPIGKPVFTVTYSPTIGSADKPKHTYGAIKATKVKAAVSLFKTSMALASNESGAPIVNVSGDVVGVATSAPVEPGRAAPRNVGFAVGAEHIRPLLDEVAAIRDEWPATLGALEMQIDALRLRTPTEWFSLGEAVDRTGQSVWRVLVYE